MKTFDTRQLRRTFGRAARNYEATAVLQREVETRLLEQLTYFEGEGAGGRTPERVLDLGCGPGHASAVMHKRWPRAQVIGVDMSLPMLREAARKVGWLGALRSHPVQRVCADVSVLPFADASVDVIFSNLCLQWVTDLPAALTEFRRLLRPRGVLLFSTFGPRTLHELREAFAAVDDQPHVSGFAHIQQVGDALMSAGFVDPVLDQDDFTLTYPDARTLMRELRAIGATHATADRRRTLTGKARMQRAIAAYETQRHDGVLPSTWEVIYAHAWGPEPGAPRRDSEGEIVSFPANAIPIRKRS